MRSDHKNGGNMIYYMDQCHSIWFFFTANGWMVKTNRWRSAHADVNRDKNRHNMNEIAEKKSTTHNN